MCVCESMSHLGSLALAPTSSSCSRAPIRTATGGMASAGWRDLGEVVMTVRLAGGSARPLQPLKPGGTVPHPFFRWLPRGWGTRNGLELPTVSNSDL